MNIRQLLVEEHGYPEKGAEIMAAKLDALTGTFRDALEKWMTTGEIASPGEYHGYTIDRLMQEHRMNYPAAIATLDWIRRDGDKAVAMLRRGVKR